MLKELIHQFLPVVSAKKTARDLGDRSTYLGASDVPKCARYVALSKIEPERRDIRLMLHAKRGHYAESVLLDVMDESLVPFEHQVELVHPELSFLKIHPDLLLHNGDLIENATRIYVGEQKCPSEVPEVPRDEWIGQLLLQMGVVKSHYPTAEVSGGVIAFDLRGNIEEWEGFQYNESIYQALGKRAQRIWDGVQGRIEPKAEVSLTCNFCAFRGDCPAWNRDAVDVPAEVRTYLARIKVLNEQKAAIEAKLDSYKDDVKGFFGPYRFTGTIEDLTVKHSYQEPQQTVDGKLLRAKYPEVFGAVSKEKAGYWKLEVKALKKETEKKPAKGRKKSEEGGSGNDS